MERSWLQVCSYLFAKHRLVPRGGSQETQGGAFVGSWVERGCSVTLSWGLYTHCPHLSSAQNSQSSFGGRFQGSGGVKRKQWTREPRTSCSVVFLKASACGRAETKTFTWLWHPLPRPHHPPQHQPIRIHNTVHTTNHTIIYTTIQSSHTITYGTIHSHTPIVDLKENIKHEVHVLGEAIPGTMPVTPSAGVSEDIE